MGAGRLQGVAVMLACAGGCHAVDAPRPRREAKPVVEPAQRESTPSVRELRLPVAHLPTATDEADEAAIPEEIEVGPRTVPAGTPPGIARVFERLPVAIHDEPPVGAVGATGIHVDKIWLGQAYEREGCTGEEERFSLTKHGQVNVCFRVVHSRVEESVDVRWEKDGAPFRRRSVQIPELHAYRTRAYLVLRREYIGSWKARVLSVDGIELAARSFVVVE